MDYSFAGKSILITGGGQGIGRSLVQRFHDDGAKVYTIDKNSETIQKLKKELPNVRAEVVDLADWDETRRVVQSFGVIEFLINNAAVLITQDFMDITKDAAMLQFEVNVAGIINVSQIVAKNLMEERRRGSIVNMSSIFSRLGSSVGTCAYAVTKAGIENLSKSMALELGPNKIRVNCITPGAVDSPMCSQNSTLDEFVEDELFSRMIVKRHVTPDEVADLAMFLLSPLSSMIVGRCIEIEGGLLAS